LDSDSTSQYGKYAVKILEGVPGRRLRTGGRCVADMRKEWFRSKVAKLLLAGLLSFALVGALYVQWLAAERQRLAKAEPPTQAPHSQPAAPSTKSADDMAAVVRPPVPTAPEPKPAPATEDRRGQTASVAQPIPAEEPPKPELKLPAAAENRPAAPVASGTAERPAPSPPVGGENRAEQPAAVERPATAAEPAKPAPAPP
jgi:cytoskeletal protein RodZ